MAKRTVVEDPVENGKSEFNRPPCRHPAEQIYNPVWHENLLPDTKSGLLQMRRLGLRGAGKRALYAKGLMQFAGLQDVSPGRPSFCVLFPFGLYHGYDCYGFESNAVPSVSGAGESQAHCPHQERATSRVLLRQMSCCL